ncbi:hypothetical protein Tco_0757089 [Tanacetum coccineum]
MYDRYNTERRMEKKFKEDDLRMNRHEYDISALDTANGKVYKEMEALREELREAPSEPPNGLAFVPRSDDPYVIIRMLLPLLLEMMMAMTPLHLWTHSLLSHIDPQLVADKVAEALAADRAARENANGSRGNAGGSGGQGGAPPARECSFSRYMKCNPTTFHRNEGAIELCCWFKKTETLTWWNSQVTTLGIDVANEKPWTEVKNMMTEEFCPDEEIQRMENEIQNLKLRDTNIVEAYIKGLPENIKGETTSSKPMILNDAVRMAHTLMEQKVQAKAERVAEGNKRK